MRKRRLKQKAGIYLSVISLLVLIIDRTTGLISAFIGKQVCGDQYLCPVGGVVCDRSCGFNTDMYLAFFLILMLLLGIALIISSKKRILKKI
ncbi:hypothetical protein YH65_09175 [Sulfurovum lithotrophicum]|uniref:Uncharacterized protein n=1 Tax=Sulfurovum lithotrophicum TaxID=206403 RepID=A0A7U4RR84_9BACT|nr:hypothetical protein [Sulfurovum lithotrophicum]AKF25526.1 hypothetical protein YH65_09175 [Sulfurovum lithotrophicum]